MSHLQEELFVRVSASPDGCVCPGDVVTYECTVIGRTTTVWRGSAVHCTESNNEVVFLLNEHNDHTSSGGIYRSCKNGNSQGRIVRVENDSISLVNYTSQLNITLTSDLVNQSIECVDDDGSSETVIGSANITEGKQERLYNW